ncbi:uncharacterized protein B0I36DRAFT_361513 [Microdochium trichocladiopsis]|uniref:Secreted protein n=1 Tax=Microdochium trichocladiopsis TaxID=1682393 RepID=A0A9P9BRF1_9PEZI|nr:uncharacterized protein B0I36DRAFT_361513 [Microdochium trichocladiopsis]KAH7032740.1 hypothetical protein B0I36DRAFT_361513 [Microdochium trichocladiopsis]
MRPFSITALMGLFIAGALGRPQQLEPSIVTTTVFELAFLVVNYLDLQHGFVSHSHSFHQFFTRFGTRYFYCVLFCKRHLFFGSFIHF